MRQAELNEIARLASRLTAVSCSLCAGTGQWMERPKCPRCWGKGTVELGPVILVLRGDATAAQRLSADDVASCRYPLCPGGPMGRLVCEDYRSETGLMRVSFGAAELLAWALKQGAKLPAGAR